MAGPHGRERALSADAVGVARGAARNRRAARALSGRGPDERRCGPPPSLYGARPGIEVTAP